MCQDHTTVNKKGIKYNTSYYRRNKSKRFCVHKCPHCDYETTGPKQALKAHIWAKHTPENERPFQCPCFSCKRGFASKANLKKHIKKKHNIEIPKLHKSIVAFQVLAINKNNQRTRLYNDSIFIDARNLLDGVSHEDFYYDVLSKSIKIKIHTKKSIIRLHKKMLKTKLNN